MLSSRDLRPDGQRAQLHWRRAIYGVAETDIAVSVVPPSPQLAISQKRRVLEREGEFSTGTFRNTRPGCASADLHRRGAIGYIAESQVAVAVVAPRPQRAVGSASNRLLAPSYMRPCRECADLHWG